MKLYLKSQWRHFVKKKKLDLCSAFKGAKATLHKEGQSSKIWTLTDGRWRSQRGALTQRRQQSWRSAVGLEMVWQVPSPATSCWRGKHGGVCRCGTVSGGACVDWPIRTAQQESNQEVIREAHCDLNDQRTVGGFDPWLLQSPCQIPFGDILTPSCSVRPPSECECCINADT